MAVLAAMRELGTFRLPELVAKSGVPENTVQTVLTRLPEDWLLKAPELTGAKGRPPLRYTLTDVGHGGIGENLSRLTEVAEPDARAVDGDVPLGLASAEDTLVAMKSESDPKRLAALRNDASRDLKWAEREVRGSSYEGSRERLLARITDLGRALDRTVGASQPVVVDVQPREPVMLAETDEEEESWFEYLKRQVWERVRVRPRSRPPIGLAWPALMPSLASGRHVVIMPLAEDAATVELAMGADWAFRGAVGFSGSKNLTVHTIRPGSMPELLQVLLTSGQGKFRDTEFVFVLDSKTMESAAEEALRQWGSHDRLSCQVLDLSFSQKLASVMGEHQLGYVPNAGAREQFRWVETALQRFFPQQREGRSSRFGELTVR